MEKGGQLSEKWKILFTIPNFDTAGSGKALLNIASRLDKKIFEPYIACLHDKGEFFKVVEESGIPIHIFQFTTPMTRRIKGLFQCWGISRQMKKINPNLIHSFHYAPDYSEAIAARMAGIPWIFTKKNMNWGGKSKNGWKLRSFLAAHILAQNTDMIRDFFHHRKNVSLVPRGVDTDKFSSGPKVTSLMHKYNISTHEKVILTVANLVPVKGIEILLDAFQKLSKNHDSLRLLIVGDNDNDYGCEMEKKATQSVYSDKIHFTGKVQDVKEYYSIADVFVLPTLDKGRREGCPVSLLEAMSSGLLIIASDIPGVRDILKSFPDSMFLAGNVVALYQKISLLLQIDFKQENRNNYRLRVEQFYSIHREVDQHQSIYEKCLTH